jgi:hypothetical protein
MKLPSLVEIYENGKVGSACVASFYTKDVGSRFFQNAGNLLEDYTASHPTKLQSYVPQEFGKHLTHIRPTDTGVL